MKWASKMGARHVVFVPPDPDGYSVRNMEAGTDEPKQRDAASLRAWLLEHGKEGKHVRNGEQAR
jgi:hypothetical protein